MSLVSSQFFLAPQRFVHQTKVSEKDETALGTRFTQPCHGRDRPPLVDQPFRFHLRRSKHQTKRIDLVDLVVM